MNKNIQIAIISIAVAVVVILGLAWAGSQNGAELGGIPVFALAAGFILVIQWGVFLPSWKMQTEKYYDLTGSLTYIVTAVLAFFLSAKSDLRSVLLLVLVLIWAGRLGSFLFLRVRKAGKDGRFDEIKPSFLRYLNAWTLQGLWILFTMAAALAAMTSSAQPVELGLFASIGLPIWVIGFAFEAFADWQKSSFRRNPENKDSFIRTGLWAWSRHPNYFGEILIWTGVALIAIPVLEGWQFVTLISPLFVTLLITRISGIPILERRADEKWSGQDDYEQYKKNTPVLIPRKPREE